MIIKKEIIDKIYQESDLLKVINSRVQMEKKGANYVGKSPFVDEKTPSFTYSPAKNIYKDFSSGQGGNNGVAFLRQLGLSWIDAVKEVAEICNIQLEYEEESEKSKAYFEKIERKTERSLLATAIAKAYHKAFLDLPDDHPAKIEIFEKRKYSVETVKKYLIGFAPGHKFIQEKCSATGRVQDACEIGLLNEKNHNDTYIDRITYPFLNNSTKYPTVGIAGRRISDDKKYAKWLNPKDSVLYEKKNYWYGIAQGANEIAKTGIAWIVEGYNDVISMQINGIPNTLASCGTAIHDNQIKKLYRLCKKVILCADGDSAGIKSMIENVQKFIKNDFRVFVKILDDGLDPDDYTRTKEFDPENFAQDFEADKIDGLKFLLSKLITKEDEIEDAKTAKSLVSMIASVTDEETKNIYAEWIASESKVGKAQINKWLKEEDEQKEVTDLPQPSTYLYLLPKVVTTPLKDLIDTIEQYQMFSSDNRIFVLNKSDKPPYTFRQVTNFDIRIIQHMQDEKFPKKLIWMKNVYGREVIYDVMSQDVNTPMSFENMVTNHGKFTWMGDRKAHQVLKMYLFNEMGTGRMIDVLGWQPEGFWAWNNLITIPANPSKKIEQKTIKVDGNGVFTHDDVSYYIPSANRIYANNMYKFEAQKKFYVKDTKNDFLSYATQMIKVHREHGMMGLLFTISSMFQDVVVNELGFFPMLFCFGPASSGKDQLAECCQSFFGRPQTAINLEGGVSTIKAQVREFAQFSNSISHLSEYKNGDPQLDGVLKGLWDRRGYKRGNIDSHVGTESIPILSSVFLTGNYAPDQEALVTRLIWNIMEKTTFSDQEIKEYEKLADMTKKGVSGLTPIFLNQRHKVIEEFKAKHREFKATLGTRHKDANSRMVTNLAVLGSFYQIFSNVVSFPFTMEEMLTHFESILEKQMNKLDSASLVNRFWECFLASMRVGQKNEQIRFQRDYKIVGNKLYFNFTHVFNRIQRQWYSQYKDNAPAKSLMMNEIKKDRCFSEIVQGTRMSPGRNGKSTSAYVVRLNEISIHEEIISNMHFQAQENKTLQDHGTESFFDTPATPNEEKNNEKTGDLPF